MLGLLIGLALRQSRPGAGVPPPAPPATVPTAISALLAESGVHLLAEGGSLLLLEM